jgi:hypothetical protein
VHASAVVAPPFLIATKKKRKKKKVATTTVADPRVRCKCLILVISKQRKDGLIL